METIIVEFIRGILNEANDLVNTMLANLVRTGLWAESMVPVLGSVFDGLSQIAFSLGISLIVLKFVKKGFDIYILWTDGDADADPLGLLTNFVRALAVAICFPTLYDWLAKVVQMTVDSMTKVESMNMAQMTEASFAGDIFSGVNSIVKVVLFLIFFILVFLVAFQFIKRGFELFVLRIGVPIACAGLLENDKGVFKVYSQKFFQSALAILVQVVLLKLGLILMASASSGDFMTIIYAVSAVALAFSMPKLLSEFVASMGGGGGGALNVVYQGSRMVQMAKGLVKR